MTVTVIYTSLYWLVVLLTYLPIRREERNYCIKNNFEYRWTDIWICFTCSLFWPLLYIVFIVAGSISAVKYLRKQKFKFKPPKWL